MPGSGATAETTLTFYRYQEERSSRFYEVGDTETVWAMTKLAATSVYVENTVTFTGALHTVSTSVLVLISALVW